MSNDKQPQWIHWTARLQAIAQTGLAFATDPYDIERYQALQKIAAEMLAAGTEANISKIQNFLTTDSGYATPKVDVRGAVFRDGKILLVRERSDGKWTLPGGWADVNESPAENVVREIREESGFETRVVKLLAIFDRSKHPHEPAFPFHVYKLFLHCEIIGGSARADTETDAVDFFSETDLPDLSATRITSGQIHRLFEHHRQPNLTTDFD